MESIIHLFISTIQNCLPRGLGHLDPSYITSEEYDFLISEDWEVPSEISIIDLTYAVSYLLFCTRLTQKHNCIILDEQPSWLAPLRDEEIVGMESAVDFIVDQKLSEHKRSGYLAA